MRIMTLFAAAVVAGCNAADRQQSPDAPAPNAAQETAPAPVNEATGGTSSSAPQAEGPAAHPCRVQDGKPVPANRIRAIGTEPFWGARIDGRCVTYSTPEDQAGTRIWTRFSGTAEQGSWAGALDGRRFELNTAPDPRCSDGMSDNIYPIAVTLFVRGEQRRGCAEPLQAGKRP